MRGMMRLTFLCKSFCLVFLLILLSAAVLSASNVQLFELQHRQAGELVETVRALLGEQGRVSAYRNLLVVHAEADELNAVAQLVAFLDTAPAMLRITVEQGRMATVRERAVGGALRAEEGSVTLGVGRVPVAGGSTMRIHGDDAAVSVSARDGESQGHHVTSQFIMVLSGESAGISVGQQIPFTGRLRLHCRRHAGCVKRAERVETLKVDTGFEVTPVLLGEGVQLDIRPFMAFSEDRSSDRIVFHELVTRVVVSVGEWLDLGGQVAAGNELNREILGSREGLSTTETGIRLRVDRE